MRINYNATGNARKELVKAIETATGAKAEYMKMPTCAYEIDYFTVTKDGALEFDDRANSEEVEAVLEAIAQAGFEPEEALETAPEATEEEESEATQVTISVPLSGHTGDTLRNLINLLFQRQVLLNKATGSHFRVDEDLTADLLGADKSSTVQEFLQTIGMESEKLDGLEFSEDKITFTGFAPAEDPETIKAYMQLASLMNKQALTQSRIVAKTVDDTNEKYAFRIWLIRIGMTGNEYKQTRKILLSKLSGNCAFRTEEQSRQFSLKQKKLREEAKAAEQEEGGAGDEITE